MTERSEPDLDRVRSRMIDLEVIDSHERRISVEGVVAELLGHADEEAIGRAFQAEVGRTQTLLDVTHERRGVVPTLGNVAATGFLQGVTFAVAYFLEANRLTGVDEWPSMAAQHGVLVRELGEKCKALRTAAAALEEAGYKLEAESARRAADE
jgi:hypothetical protein